MNDSKPTWRQILLGRSNKDVRLGPARVLCILVGLIVLSLVLTYVVWQFWVEKLVTAPVLSVTKTGQLGFEVYGKRMRTGVEQFTLFALISLFISLYALFVVRSLALHVCIWILWTISPPIWYLIEYFYFFPHFGVREAFDNFKFGQDVSAKLWAAALAISSARLFQDVKGWTTQAPGS